MGVCRIFRGPGGPSKAKCHCFQVSYKKILPCLYVFVPSLRWPRSMYTKLKCRCLIRKMTYLVDSCPRDTVYVGCTYAPRTDEGMKAALPKAKMFSFEFVQNPQILPRVADRLAKIFSSSCRCRGSRRPTCHTTMSYVPEDPNLGEQKQTNESSCSELRKGSNHPCEISGLSQLRTTREQLLGDHFFMAGLPYVACERRTRGSPPHMTHDKPLEIRCTSQCSY